MAHSIARKFGILVNPENYSNCLTGADIGAISGKYLKSVIGSVTVFARTAPKNKIAIIQAFQSNSSIVAITEDDVNDALALKITDIGISMGKSRSDVSQDAADIILVNYEFVTILHAVKEDIKNSLELDDIYELIVITLLVFWIDEFRKHYHNQKQDDDWI
ncbi:14846_t:CDS:2 [Cetraspora pellucida]|uniref:14846_t:CDS:1 n=1 Tax=Cetraspora pellucida TaxID=1433469 RepID=A0A9N9HX12_9GLOM|nr:14846_t:CDS:2 [Cetraspora pellucida]